MKLRFLILGLAVLAALTHRLLGESRLEWHDQAAPGAQATAISGSLTRRALYPRGRSLDVAFRDGGRFTWIGDASMAPVGLVERAGGAYLVLLEWGRTRADAASATPPKSIVCLVRDMPGGLGGEGGPGNAVSPLFVPSETVARVWPWTWRARIEREVVVSRYQRLGVDTLVALAAAAPAVAGCPDLRRADHS